MIFLFFNSNKKLNLQLIIIFNNIITSLPNMNQMLCYTNTLLLLNMTMNFPYVNENTIKICENYTTNLTMNNTEIVFEHLYKLQYINSMNFMLRKHILTILLVGFISSILVFSIRIFDKNSTLFFIFTPLF